MQLLIPAPAAPTSQQNLSVSIHEVFDLRGAHTLSDLSPHTPSSLFSLSLLSLSLVAARKADHSTLSPQSTLPTPADRSWSFSSCPISFFSFWSHTASKCPEVACLPLEASSWPCFYVWKPHLLRPGRCGSVSSFSEAPPQSSPEPHFLSAAWGSHR